MPATMFSAAVAAPGTPQRLTSVTVPTLPAISGVLAGSANPRGRFISFQAAPSNTAANSIYVGGPAMNIAGKTGIGLVLLVGTAPVTIPLADAATDLGDFYIDTDGSAGDRVYVMLIG